MVDINGKNVSRLDLSSPLEDEMTGKEDIFGDTVCALQWCAMGTPQEGNG